MVIIHHATTGATVDPAHVVGIIDVPQLDLSPKRYTEILETTTPGVPWLVEPLISEGTRVLFYGESNSLKSWLLIDLALHLASGKPWLGHLRTQQSPVLYIDEEMTQRTLHRRVKRLGLGAGLGTTNIPAWFSNMPGLTITPTRMSQLVEGLRQEGIAPRVIIIDALRRVLVGNENEAHDVAFMWNTLKPLTRAGVTVIISHHMKKPNPKWPDSAKHRASGSTDLIAGSDIALAVTRERGTTTVSIDTVKNRDAEEGGPIVADLTFHDDATDGPVVVGNPLPRQEVTASEWATMLILGHLKRGVVADAEEVLKAVEAGGTSRRTGQRALADLEATGRVVRDGSMVYSVPPGLMPSQSPSPTTSNDVRTRA